MTILKLCDSLNFMLRDVESGFFFNFQDPLACSTCGKRFSRKDALSRHVKTHNKKAARVSCSICKKTFSRQYDLDRHMKFHSKDKSFECPLCNIRFTKKDNLLVHQRMHENLNYPCTPCHERFNSKTNLKRHIQTQLVSLTHESKKSKFSPKNTTSKKEEKFL